MALLNFRKILTMNKLVSIYPTNTSLQKSLIMKCILVLIVFALITANASSQPNNSQSLALGVEKLYSTSKKAFIFKTHSFLRIKTEDGRKYLSNEYSFSDKFVVMNKKDTILFDDILWIQGRVYGSEVRKLGGAAIALCAIPASAFPIFYVSYGGGPVLLAAAPFIGMMYGGIRLTGARKFRKAHSCYVKTFEQ